MTDAVSDAIQTPAPVRRGRWLWWLLVLMLLLAAVGWRGWHWWQAQQARAAAVAVDDARQWQALDARIDALRRDQRAQAQRIAQADAGTRIVRDEVLGLGQRAALLEDSVARLADPQREGAQALRLDTVELLLVFGLQRLQLAGDLDGARNAYAQAAGRLAGVDDPAYLNLRQALAQERAALEAAGADPATTAATRLDAFAAALQAPATTASGPAATRLPWWRRALAHIVQVHPTDRASALAPDARAAGVAALQLELALARAALERRDRDDWRAALGRIGDWLPKLWPPSSQRQRLQAQLRALRDLPLTPTLPTLGSTLQQLQAMRGAH